MRKTNRALAATAGALLLSGLVPFQSALAATELPKLWNFCTNGSGGSLFDPAEKPVTVPGGEDAGSGCWINFTSSDSGKNWTGTDLQLTLTAESVAASGYSPQQLAHMLLVRTNYSATEWGEDWTVRHWTVHRDGAMTVRIPACTNNCTGVFLQLSGAPREGGAELKAQLRATGAGYDPTPMPMSFDYFGRAGTKPVAFAAPGTFVPVTPARLLDTRSGLGAPTDKVGSGRSVNVGIAGRAGVPAAGVTAVVLNVTATNPTAGSFVTAHPHGAARPTASNLNFTAGQTVPNQVTVPVGADGKVEFYNHSGTVGLIADISGYYSTTGAKFVPTGPTRVLDTREAPGKPLGEHKELDIQPNSWKHGIPPFGVTGVTMNVTATNGTAGSHLSAAPSSGCERYQGMWPQYSNLNFTAGQTIANAVTGQVPELNYCGGNIWADAVSIYNHEGSVDVIADVSGYFLQD